MKEWADGQKNQTDSGAPNAKIYTQMPKDK